MTIFLRFPVKISGWNPEDSNKISFGYFENRNIKEPNKWTASHLAKAILSGQVFHGITEGRYSDDYALDTEEDSKFWGKGRPVHLEEVARSLIEDGKSGLWFQHKKTDNGMTEISLATHSYDYKKFTFDVNCNHELKRERQESMAKNLEEVNAEILSQNKQIDLSQISDQEIYQVKYLEEDRNTGLYDEITEWMYPQQLCDLAEEQFEILEMTAIEIQDELLYQVGSLQESVSKEDSQDPRFIGAGGGKTVVTGYALKELLAEERQFSVLNISHPDNIPEMRESLQKMAEGKSWCFSDLGSDFFAGNSIEKLDAEELRINEGVEFGGMSGMT